MFIRPGLASPRPEKIEAIAKCLTEGGIIIYPTDTIYGLGCDILDPSAIENVYRLKQANPKKMNLSFICDDLKSLSNYAKQISTATYRLLKEYLPGPYTFILPASRQVPKILKSKKQTIGLRIPDNKICRAIVKQLGRPILSTSLPGESVEEYTNPAVIHEKFKNSVDAVVDGGIGGIIPSTVIDCTGEAPVIVRAGLGEFTY